MVTFSSNLSNFERNQKKTKKSKKKIKNFFKKNLKIWKSKKIQKIQKKSKKNQTVKKNPKKVQKVHKKNPKNLKIVKNGQKFRKSRKISKNLKNSLFFLFFSQKKCYPISFPLLGGRDLTRALQSSPFQKYKNLKKFQKFTFFQNKKINLKEEKNPLKKEKKCYPLSFPILGGLASTRALQSSPFQKYENPQKCQKLTFFLKK